MGPPVAAATSTAGKILQRRAIQCSFSSIFHLRNVRGACKEEAEQVERIFTAAVAVPLGLMGTVGVASVIHRKFSGE